MKWVIILLCLTSLSIPGLGQIKKNGPLAVGEYLPPFPLGKVMNNKGDLNFSYNGDSTFSDLKGKIVILDFWTSYCATCIAGFSQLSNLQNKFGDKIQIFLVNGREDEKKIRGWLSKQNAKRPSGNIVPDNLPMIVDAKELYRLFPIRGEIGYHVWIAQDGKVQLRGISENTHEKKITQLLSGEDISFVKDNALAYNTKFPFFFHKNRPLPVFSSAIGYFDDENASAYGIGINDYVDSVSGTIRNTFLNYDILSLYKKTLIAESWEGNRVISGIPLVLEVKDTSLISKRVGKKKFTDEDLIKTYCYEQILPLNTPDTKAKNIMLSDLNTFFKQKNGITGSFESRVVPCIYLKFDGKLKKIRSSNTTEHFSYRYDSNLTRTLVYKRYPANKLFKDYFSMFQKHATIDIEQIIVDSVSIRDNIDLELPDPYNIKNFAHLYQILRHHGFLLEKGNIELDAFVLKQLL